MSQSPLLAAVDAAQDDRSLQHDVVVHVNERPVVLPRATVTGLEIKEAAIDQGLPIQLDFILVEELGGGRTRIVDNGDVIHVTPETRFLANDGDDNS